MDATSLTFGNQSVGTTSASQSVTLTDTGTAALTVSSITLSGANGGDFRIQTNTCGASVAAGANCAISVAFTPAATGTRTATLNITDNASNSPQTVSLTGTGSSSSGPAATLSATSLTFGNQNVGTTSASQSVTLTNSGNATLTVSSVTITGTNSGDFTPTSACGASVAAGANCAISVTFTPAATGTRTATLNVTDNASNSPQTVSLTGTGASSSGPTVSPASLSFGNITVGTTSASQSVTLTNNGTTTLTSINVTITGTNSGDFAETNTCGSSVAAGGNCTATVTFKPSTSGSESATLNFNDGASNSPQTVILSGGSDPLGSATGTLTTCPAGGITGTSCYSLTISCPNLSNTAATVKVTAPSGSPVGTVIFLVGGGGTGFYDQQWTYGATTVNAVLQAGFTAAQISFDTGWLTGPSTDGPRQTACRFATASQWIFDNTSIHPGGTTEPLCATGNSGGAGAIGYALSHYGLGSIFSMVEPTSGPPMGRVDYGCICNQPDAPTPCGGTNTTCYGTAAGYIDSSYGSTICSSAEATHSTTNQPLFYHDSVASEDATYAYPTTFVHVLFGGLDTGSAVPLAMDWVNLVTTKTLVECVVDAGHEMPNAPDAASKIGSDLVSGCHK